MNIIYKYVLYIRWNANNKNSLYYTTIIFSEIFEEHKRDDRYPMFYHLNILEVQKTSVMLSCKKLPLMFLIRVKCFISQYRFSENCCIDTTFKCVFCCLKHVSSFKTEMKPRKCLPNFLIKYKGDIHLKTFLAKLHILATKKFLDQDFHRTAKLLLMN